MQTYDGRTLYSASDLAGFLECPHLVALDLRNLESPLPAAEDDEQAQLLQEKGFAHEAAYLGHLRAAGADVADLGASGHDVVEKSAATRHAVEEGRDVIFQACLYARPFVGHADFLRRVATPSRLGGFSYEVVDTKLARAPRAKFIIQLSLYSELLAGIQGVLPSRFHLVLGDGTECSFGLASYLRYFRKLRERFLAFVAAAPPDSYPERCGFCDLCRWRNLCTEQWDRDDHLNQVANISKIQIGKLRERANVRTLAELARLDPDARVKGIQDTTLDRLRSQAALQLAKRETGEDRVEVLPSDAFGRRGFHRLPEPDPCDVFFDMEGDPLEDGGLEYLFGAYFQDADGRHFLPFWGHDRSAEREAFRNFMAFVTERLAHHPGMHIYHYGQYEVTALKRLMSLHGVCEAEVDNLLRTERLVDLYRVVREGIRVSEPGYSIKNLEAFYMEKRTGAVKDAGTSVVWYEQWKQTGDSALLAQIGDYNHDDCRSTALLRDWLLSLRPDSLPWYQGKPKPDDGEEQNQQIHEVEARLAEYGERLVGSLPEDRQLWDSEAEFRELVFHLLDFHRRADKPVWWAMFARHEMTEEELVDDPESIGGLELLPDSPPVQVKRSAIYSYRFPEQEHKRRAGERCRVAETLDKAGSIDEIDEPNRIVRIKRALKHGPLPDRFSLIPVGPIDTKVLREALYRFADSILEDDGKYPALTGVLRRARPSIDGLSPGTPIVPAGTALLEQTIDAVKRLNNSHIFIQGPPGAGKTYTGSHVIAALLRAGKRVGVSSNSHKAINNLLLAVEQRATEQGFTFRGVKKSSGEDSFVKGIFNEDVTTKDEAIGSEAALVAGTAWLFADPEMDQTLDYLFVDEAGQVALANLISMGTAARNLILLGDQMQLQQPIQGVHPGHSGESSLDYLLQGEATIAPDRGIFLDVTWRMHEDVCRFISDAIYDSRLVAEPANQNQCLVLGAGAHPALRPTGVRFVPATHDGCSQRSAEEAQLVHELYHSLLRQSYRDRAGQLHPMAAQNILVVAPYNMQVNLLRETMPADARVGTVDKFQGQEAEVVIISMATSSGEYLPRFIEFLYSKNRLNVAISRARCLALLVASPELLAIRCHTPEQIELVNTLCWVEEYATGLSREPPQCAIPTVR